MCSLIEIVKAARLSLVDEREVTYGGRAAVDIFARVTQWRSNWGKDNFRINPSHNSVAAMIQRRLLRSSQLVCQSSRYHIANPVFRSRSILPNIASATYQRIPRLYTTATDTADAATTDAPPSTDPSSSQLTPEDNLRKDLESKTREVIDLKVCSHRISILL